MNDNINVYYCIDDIGLTNEVGEMLKMSIASALENSGLCVKCLYCGSNERFINLLSSMGVEVILHKSRIEDAIINAHNTINFPLHARGAYLRYEISEIDSNEYSLYVDCDVFFVSKFVLPKSLPTLVSGCKERGRDDEFNSGVLLFNNINFKKSAHDFLSYAKARFGTWAVGVDQRPFNDFYKGKLELLDDSYNWRPSFGVNDNASMIHFHGTKLEEVYGFLLNKIPEQYADDYIIERASICSSDLGSVVYYLRAFSKYLHPTMSPSYVRKYRHVVDYYSDKFLGRSLFIKSANSFSVEKFLLSNLQESSFNINRRFVFTYDAGVKQIALFPAKSFFYGVIEVSFLSCSVVPPYMVEKSTGYMETSYLDDTVIIKYCSLSYASEISLYIGDSVFDSMAVVIRGVGLGVTSAFDSDGDSILICDLI